MTTPAGPAPRSPPKQPARPTVPAQNTVSPQHRTVTPPQATVPPPKITVPPKNSTVPKPAPLLTYKKTPITPIHPSRPSPNANTTPLPRKVTATLGTSYNNVSLTSGPSTVAGDARQVHALVSRSNASSSPIDRLQTPQRPQSVTIHFKLYISLKTSISNLH